MTPEDTIDVLSAITAIDRRTVGENDVIVWHRIIGDLPKDLALQAVLNHARDCPGVWLEPGHVVAGVRAIRRDQYERQTLEERAAYEDHIDERIKHKILEIAEAKTIPADDAPRRQYMRPTINPRTVGCPYCHASPGQRCTNGNQPQRTGAHPSRVDAAATKLYGEPQRKDPRADVSAVVVADRCWTTTPTPATAAHPSSTAQKSSSPTETVVPYERRYEPVSPHPRRTPPGVRGQSRRPWRRYDRPRLGRDRPDLPRLPAVHRLSASDGRRPGRHPPQL